MDYANQCHTIHEEIDGIGPWLWVKSDWEGYRWPKEDWLNEHKYSWLSNIKNTRVCIQAGGLCGMYPRLLSEYFDLVYTFEPDPLSFYCLVNNCQKDNIVKMQCALGESNCLVDNLSEIDHNRGMNHMIEGSKIPMINIDSLDLPYCDFIQLDIEGYEAEALIGASMTIEKHRPIICVERFWKDRRDPAEILTELDYVEVGKSAVLDYIYIPYEYSV